MQKKKASFYQSIHTVLLCLLGSISNVVLAASISEDDANLGDPGSCTLARAEAVVCQVAESLTSHGSSLHVGHLLHSILQVFLVVKAAQRKLLQDREERFCLLWKGKEKGFREESSIVVPV